MDFMKRPLRQGLRLLVKNVRVRGRYRLVSLVGPWIAPPSGEPLRLNGLNILLDHRIEQHRMMYYGLYEQNMMNFLKRNLRAGDVVLEPGANVAYVSAHCLGLVGEKGHVHSFEPSPAANAHIKRYNQVEEHANWSLWDMALSDHEGKDTFYDTPRVMQFGYACLATAATPRDGVPSQVALATVDGFCLSHGIKHVRFLKLDIEGSEFSALKGATRMLADGAIDIIMVETNTAGTARPIAERINALLLQAGYRSFHVLHNGKVKPLDVMAMPPSREDVIWMRKGVVAA
ncbi:MAG: FkbM family methyltransferase [Bacteroidetes bacterium]|nr:FkbM family methyltransferase [Bacteroidota bacterium]